MDYQPPSQDQVRDKSPASVNKRIDREARGALVEASTPAEIRARIAELDSEWHIDRALIAVFSVVGGFTSLRAMGRIKRTGHSGLWGALFFTQIGFLAHHAFKGWCPPVSVLRRLGLRTAQEIAAERGALERKLAHMES